MNTTSLLVVFIKLWLRVPVGAQNKDGRGQMGSGRKDKKGTPHS